MTTPIPKIFRQDVVPIRRIGGGLHPEVDGPLLICRENFIGCQHRSNVRIVAVEQQIVVTGECDALCRDSRRSRISVCGVSQGVLQ